VVPAFPRVRADYLCCASRPEPSSLDLAQRGGEELAKAVLGGVSHDGPGGDRVCVEELFGAASELGAGRALPTGILVCA
jgi:hypothetical protein